MVKKKGLATTLVCSWDNILEGGESDRRNHEASRCANPLNREYDVV